MHRVIISLNNQHLRLKIKYIYIYVVKMRSMVKDQMLDSKFKTISTNEMFSSSDVHIWFML